MSFLLRHQQEEHLKHTLQATQYLHSKIHPHAPSHDIRHDADENLMAYDVRDGVEEGEDGTARFERAGVTHFCSWLAQGHPKPNVPAPLMHCSFASLQYPL